MYWKDCRSGIYSDEDLIELGEHVCFVWKWIGERNLKLLLFALNPFSEIGYVFCWQHRPRLRQGFSEFIHIKIVQWINQRYNSKASNYLKKLKALAQKKKKKVKIFYTCSSSLYGHNHRGRCVNYKVWIQDIACFVKALTLSIFLLYFLAMLRFESCLKKIVSFN